MTRSPGCPAPSSGRSPARGAAATSSCRRASLSEPYGRERVGEYSVRWLSSIVWFLPLLAAAQNCPAILDRAQKAFDAAQFPVAAAELEAALSKCPLEGVRIRMALGQTQ